jgi:hypothetical protein
MANQKVEMFGSFDKETKGGQKRYKTEFGTQYLPQSLLTRLGNPERIKVTIENADSTDEG